jgi:exodeoxyribonuclease-5
VTAALIELDKSQAQAFNEIQRWLTARVKDPKLPQIYRLGGHAGSGKTTLLTEVTRFCEAEGIRYALATFAGKAADVLRRKGLDSAQTIHSLIYKPNHTAMAEVRRLNEQLKHEGLSPEERKALQADLKKQRDLQWTLRTTLDDTDLLVIDEASMVSGRITNQLKSFGRPILAVGDPAQLPPVELSPTSDPLFFSQTPDSKLEGKHRFGTQALLGEVASAARSNQPIPGEAITPLPRVNLLDFDVILVHSNVNRWKYVHAVRGAQGKPLDQPVPGDRITFWQNNREYGVFNGGSAVVQAISEAEKAATKYPAWAVEAVSDTGEPLSLTVDKRGFRDQAALDDAAKHRKSDSVIASFSEALTVHKAQGSEWPRVLIADHPNVGDGESRVRWRYTAVTRASEALVLANDAFSEPVKLARGVTLDLG